MSTEIPPSSPVSPVSPLDTPSQPRFTGPWVPISASAWNWRRWQGLLSKTVGLLSACAVAAVVIGVVQHSRRLHPQLETDYLERLYGPDLRAPRARNDVPQTVRDVDVVDMTKNEEAAAAIMGHIPVGQKRSFKSSEECRGGVP